jgi:hypothetical protein
MKFRNILLIWGEGWLGYRPVFKLEVSPLLAVGYWLLFSLEHRRFGDFGDANCKAERLLEIRKNLEVRRNLVCYLLKVFSRICFVENFVVHVCVIFKLAKLEANLICRFVTMVY